MFELLLQILYYTQQQYQQERYNLDTELEFNQEIKNIMIERRKNILFYVYMVTVVLFMLMTTKNIYYHDNYSIAIGSISLILIVFSFICFYKKEKYDTASYILISTIGCATISAMINSEFTHYTPVFIIPFTIGTFFLFGWKKSIYLNILFFMTLIILTYVSFDNITDTFILKNQMSIITFLAIYITIFAFIYLSETRRAEAYRLLVEANYKKDLLYKELHHRVKNNLNIVTSMLSLQAQEETKEVQEIIKISKTRIQAIAMVHTMLYISDSIEKINFKDFLKELSKNLKSFSDKNINFKIETDEIELPLNTIIPIGLIINELLTNSFKYAFNDTAFPKITITLTSKENDYILTYHDNGVGIKPLDVKNMGLKIVELNIRQLKGTLITTHNNGLGYEIVFKKVQDL